MTIADQRIAAWLSQYVKAPTPTELLPASPDWIRDGLALLIGEGVMSAGEALLECALEYNAIIPREYFPEGTDCHGPGGPSQ